MHCSLRVNFDTQKSPAGSEILLIEAAKSFFAPNKPFSWSILALLLPRFLLPAMKVLAEAFPDHEGEDTCQQHHL